ncbi:MAG: hypothetical protein MZV70_41130 [Desulfobacterales bacterium]|nr:hypothetical protein [Desulfobacterales bacterium]
MPRPIIGWFYGGNGMKLYQEAYDSAGYNLKPFVFTMLAPETAGWFRKAINKQEDLKGMAIRYPGLPGQGAAEARRLHQHGPRQRNLPVARKGRHRRHRVFQPGHRPEARLLQGRQVQLLPGLASAGHQPGARDQQGHLEQDEPAAEGRHRAGRPGRDHLHPGAVHRRCKARPSSRTPKPVSPTRSFHRSCWTCSSKTWNEVIAEETAKDPMLKKIWDDYKSL